MDELNTKYVFIFELIVPAEIRDIVFKKLTEDYTLIDGWEKHSYIGVPGFNGKYHVCRKCYETEYGQSLYDSFLKVASSILDKQTHTDELSVAITSILERIKRTKIHMDKCSLAGANNAVDTVINYEFPMCTIYTSKELRVSGRAYVNEERRGYNNKLIKSIELKIYGRSAILSQLVNTYQLNELGFKYPIEDMCEFVICKPNDIMHIAIIWKNNEGNNDDTILYAMIKDITNTISVMENDIAAIPIRGALYDAKDRLDIMSKSKVYKSINYTKQIYDGELGLELNVNCETDTV